MSEMISVRFPNGSRNYDFDPGGLRVGVGQEVIVETTQGLEFAICTRGNRPIADGEETRPLSAVLRLATDEDRRILEWNRNREREAFRIGEERIAAHGLEMKLVRVSISFEGNKLIFFFTADGRVDFRALVRDLASVFHSRIELRQIGVRDEARMIGGLGICGRPLCCCQFLTNFLPVSIKMAKTQNLSLNPAKISGACGRLMCCLKYEQFAYEEASRRLPKAESFVQTPDGPGNVKSVDLLRETVRVSLDSDPEHLKTYRCSEILLLRNGKGNRNGIDIPAPPPRYVEERREEDPFLSGRELNWPEERPAEGTPRNPRPNRPRKPVEPRREARKEETWNKPGKPAPERAGAEGDAKRRRKPWYRNNRKNRPNR
ncbi:MAG: stage 0 sporulation family protein [Oscillibacter sp.]|nr:stage 0 sporulation family protein [Oscillibacter sp.]